MPNVFAEVLIDIFSNTDGGRLQASTRSAALQALHYRTTLSTVTGFVVWTNRLPGGKQDTAPPPPNAGVLMLTSVKP